MRIFRVFILLLVVVNVTSLALAEASLEVTTMWRSDYATPSAVAPFGYFDPNQPNYDFYMSNPFSHNGHLDANYEVSQSWEGDGKVNSTRSFTGLPAMFSLGQGHSSATATGYADAHNLQLGAHGSTASLGPYAESRVEAFFENKFTLLPGENSTLQIGDKVPGISILSVTWIWEEKCSRRVRTPTWTSSLEAKSLAERRFVVVMAKDTTADCRRWLSGRHEVPRNSTT